MDYAGAVDYLNSFKSQGIKPRIEHTKLILDELGFDYEGVVVHVAGTNGKGSVSAMMERVLRGQDMNTGLYVSPELMDFTDRVFVSGRPIGRKRLAALTSEVVDFVDGMKYSSGSPTFFEITTAVCLKHLEESGVEVMVLEVGMGGRLDSTNAVPGSLSVVTNVDFDHMEYLGQALSDIAREKSGILSDNTCLVTAESKQEPLDVLKAVCAEKNSRLVRVGVDVKYKDLGIVDYAQNALVDARNSYNLTLKLLGGHQVVNAATAIAALEELDSSGIEVNVDDTEVGLSKVVWPGRMEVVRKRPLTVLDGAHNPSGFDSLLKTMESFEYDRLFTVLGFTRTKDYMDMIPRIAGMSEMVLAVESGYAGALDAGVISREAGKYTNSKAFPSVKSALVEALRLAGRGDMVLVAGSIYLVGEARRFWFRECVL
ncbi:MAG: Mur ligase family protein [Candidatus Altiarchaeota archaeon]